MEAPYLLKEARRRAGLGRDDGVVLSADGLVPGKNSVSGVGG
jgi:hypothetical protein